METFLKISLSLTIRESIYMSHLFYSLKEKKSPIILTKKILRNSFIINKKIILNNSKKNNFEKKINFENIDFSESLDWISNLFESLKNSFMKSLMSFEKNVIITIINFILYTIINKDIKNLLEKTIELIFIKDAFCDNLFVTEYNNFFLLNDEKKICEKIENFVLKEKKVEFNCYNIILPIFLNYFDFLILEVEKIKNFFLEHLEKEFKEDFEMIKTNLNNFENVKNGFFEQKKNLIKLFSENIFFYSVKNEFSILRTFDLSNCKNSENQFLENLIKNLEKYFNLLEILISEENLIFFKNFFFEKFFIWFQKIIIRKKINYNGSCILKKEFRKFENLKHDCHEIEKSYRKLNICIELINSFDLDTYQGLAMIYEPEIDKDTFDMIFNSRIDLK